MKRIILLVTLLFVMGAQAQRSGSFSSSTNNDALSQFIYDGQYYENERLSLKKVETVYEEQWVDSTCYKDEVYYEEECGYQTVTEKVCFESPATKECKLINGKLKCKIIPGKIECPLETTTKWVCGPVKKIHQVAYTCKKKEMVAVDSVNKRFIASINFRFGYNNLYPEMLIRSEMSDEGVVTVTAENQYGSGVVLLATKNVTKNESTYFEMQNIDYEVTAYDQEALLSHISQKPAALVVSRNRIEFEVGKVQFPERAKFALKITDLRTGEVLINRQLFEQEYRTYTGYYGSYTKVMIENLRLLGVRLQYNRDYKVRVVSKVDIGEMEMLNSDIEKLQVAKTQKVYL